MKGSSTSAGGHSTARKVIERALLLLVGSASIAVIWWSISRLQKAQRESAVAGLNASRIANEVDLMQGQWTGQRTQDLGLRFTSARDSLFGDAPELAAWRAAIEEKAIPLAFQTNVRFTGSRTQAVGQTSIAFVQVALDIVPTAGVPGVRSAYQRLVELAHHIATQPKRVDLSELSIESVSNVMTHASMTIDLWAADSPLPKP
ncbi:MAG: hypothetical protein IT581_13120 [Verrucomicrobiales bacterium]|nr:hypothetical protein [Verrucomicrobiales bacterium]